MATYIAIFLFELIPAYVLWFILTKIFGITKFYRIVAICLAISLVIGYIASYRIIGYQVTMDYLTKINNQKMETVGEGITLEEENKYKEELFNSKEFKPYLLKNALKISLPPFILVLIIMLFFAKKTNKTNDTNNEMKDKIEEKYGSKQQK